jgi:hypothetical protein
MTDGRGNMGGEMYMTSVRAALVAMSLVAAACGGSSKPTNPTAPAPIPAAQACDLVNGLGLSISILSGAQCSAERGPVVRLNVRDQFGAAGSCTGTIIAPRAVLTAAHCLDGNVTTVLAWPGVGPTEYTATSFAYHPQFSTSSLLFDVGVVLFGEDLPRGFVPILTSRTARVGETAIIAGFGRDENSVTTALRAGSTTISAATSLRIESPYAPPSSAICSGDSGGPLFVQEGGTWLIAGISSATTGTACNEGTNYYQAVVHGDVRSFIRQYVPSVTER